MKMQGNTILITGGGSGIGLGLAEAFAKLDNRVIVAGRSSDKLAHAKAKGFATYTVDMMDPASIRRLATDVVRDFPQLNVVIQNAGIMRAENFVVGGNAQTQDEIIATNLLGPMRLNDALLPHLLKQNPATILTVTSGLAFVPLAMSPSYCASKAAVHSYTESLRYQLQGTSVGVIEIAPPYVQTHLGGERQASDPTAMPLQEFIDEVMGLLQTQPDAKEILVKRVRQLRFAAEGGQEKYDSVFKNYNDQITAARTRPGASS